MLVTLDADRDLEGYESVAIGFRVETRVDLELLVKSVGRKIVEIPVSPYWKDYDQDASQRPSSLPNKLSNTDLNVWGAYLDGIRIGGAIAIRQSPEYKLLSSKTNLAILIDIRVNDELRGRGIGRQLFEAAARWAKNTGCESICVETQDTNVSACRFYSAMGCQLAHCDPFGYGNEYGEAKLIWRLDF